VIVQWALVEKRRDPTWVLSPSRPQQIKAGVDKSSRGSCHADENPETKCERAIEIEWWFYSFAPSVVLSPFPPLAIYSFSFPLPFRVKFGWAWILEVPVPELDEEKLKICWLGIGLKGSGSCVVVKKKIDCWRRFIVPGAPVTTSLPISQRGQKQHHRFWILIHRETMLIFTQSKCNRVTFWHEAIWWTDSGSSRNLWVVSGSLALNAGTWGFKLEGLDRRWSKHSSYLFLFPFSSHSSFFRLPYPLPKMAMVSMNLPTPTELSKWGVVKVALKRRELQAGLAPGLKENLIIHHDQVENRTSTWG